MIAPVVVIQTEAESMMYFQPSERTRIPVGRTTRPVLPEFREKCLRGDGYVNNEDGEQEETGKAKGRRA
jgi:hypothetical protein